MLKNHISVVIPIYNSQKFLAESLESVLNQTYRDFEIICVNDGSTDDSGEILKQYSDKISIITQKNQGLASALNHGIEKMKGNWFKWFSPDDIMYPDTLEVLLKSTTNLDIDAIIYANWDIIDDEGMILRSFSESNYNDLSIFDFNVRLLDGQQINVNTTLIPKTIFNKNLRMNTTIDNVLVDYDFFLRAGLISNTKFWLVEKPLIKYRVHSNQLSHKNIVSNLNDLEELRENILSLIEEQKKTQLIKSLKRYQNSKPIQQKLMDLGLKFGRKSLPPFLTNQILIFYLNKFRNSR